VEASLARRRLREYAVSTAHLRHLRLLDRDMMQVALLGTDDHPPFFIGGVARAGGQLNGPAHPLGRERHEPSPWPDLYNDTGLPNEGIR